MKIIAFTKHNPDKISTKLNWPEEDFFLFSKNIFAVADGITRDPLNFTDFPESAKEKIVYPSPSPARKAAETFCKKFVEKCLSTKDIKKSAVYANEKIKELNKNLKVDYLKNDFAACVASFGIISENKLSYGFITDCGVAVFDKNSVVKLKTPNEGPSPKISEAILKSEKYGKNWKDHRWRARTRSHYRNNPKEKLSYGAFTGEKEAINFLRIGKTKIAKGDFIIFYSDGFTKIINSKNFSIAKEFSNLDQYFESKKHEIDGSEGTIIAINCN